MGQTVNLLVYTFGGSNPSSPTFSKRNLGLWLRKCGSSSVGRAIAFQAMGREFEPRLPLQDSPENPICLCSSGVERFLGKEEVAGSNPATGSNLSNNPREKEKIKIIIAKQWLRKNSKEPNRT